MSNREMLIASDLKAYNLRWYGASAKGSLKDYATVYADFCRNDGDYTASHATRLYTKHGVEYCSLLSILEAHYQNHKKEA